LLPYWLDSLAQDGSPDPSELESIISPSYEATAGSFVWDNFIQAWAVRDITSLVLRFLNGNIRMDASIAALAYFTKQAPTQWTTMVETLLEQDNPARLVEMMIELGCLQHECTRPYEGRDVSAVEAAIARLPRIYVEICETAVALAANDVPTLSNDARDLIARVDGYSGTVRLFRVMLDRYFALPVHDDIRWLATNATKPLVIAAVMDAAIRHNMTVELELRCPMDARSGIRVS
jgi:hypothetical protein